MTDSGLEQLLELWHLSNQPEGRIIRCLFDEHTTLIEYLRRIHQLSGGRQDPFRHYEAGVPVGTHKGLLLEAKLVKDVFGEAARLRISREMLPTFAYFEAGFQRDREYTPGAADGGGSRVQNVPETYLVEVFGDDAILPTILQQAAKFFNEGVPADYARNISGGIKSRSLLASQGFAASMAGGFFSESHILLMYAHGVPWPYANRFAGGHSVYAEVPVILRMHEAGVDPEYAVAGLRAGLDSDSIIASWEKGISAEYLVA